MQVFFKDRLRGEGRFPHPHPFIRIPKLLNHGKVLGQPSGFASRYATKPNTTNSTR